MLIVHLVVSYAHVNLCHFFLFLLVSGLAETSACGSSWTFLFTFLIVNNNNNNNNNNVLLYVMLFTFLARICFVYYIFCQIQGTRIIGAVFINGSHKEDTSCHAERRWLTQYSDICNLTRDNGGMSWYCGKPQNNQISCRDWSFSKYVSQNPRLPLTKAEAKMFT